VQAGATVARQRHNLVAAGPVSGPGDLRGAPTFAGGSDPSGRSGFRLADGSLGRGGASDGKDIGIAGVATWP
jgi:hypothetical protein